MKPHYLSHVLLLGALLGSFENNSVAAQITVKGCGVVTLSGEIDSQTPTLLQHSVDNCRRHRTPVLDLDSPGGDLDAAMQAGRIVRTWQGITDVPKGAQCASACVFVLLGGVQRLVEGTIGLHRPYSTDMTSSSDEAAKKYRSMRAKVLSYLQEMNIPDRLLDAMNAVGPQRIRWLSGSKNEKELEELWIQGRDPVWEDLALSRKAQELNISNEELIKRAQLAQACEVFLKKGDSGRYSECHDAMIDGGISMQEFLRRSQLAQKQCEVFRKKGDDEKYFDCRYTIIEEGHMNGAE
jgi:hypothetical protein